MRIRKLTSSSCSSSDSDSTEQQKSFHPEGENIEARMRRRALDGTVVTVLPVNLTDRVRLPGESPNLCTCDL